MYDNVIRYIILTHEEINKELRALDVRKGICSDCADTHIHPTYSVEAFS